MENSSAQVRDRLWRSRLHRLNFAGVASNGEPMRKSFLILALLSVALPQLIASSENAVIMTAAKSYVLANSAITKFDVTVEKLEGDFARAKVNPKDPGAADPAWIFLKKNQGKWIGLTMGTAFEAEDYQKLGIPKSLRVD